MKEKKGDLKKKKDKLNQETNPHVWIPVQTLRNMRNQNNMLFANTKNPIVMIIN